MKTYKKLTSLAAAGILFTAGTAMSATTFIDLSNATDPSDPAGDGKYWNTLGDNAGGNGDLDASIADLVDSGGTATGFGLTIDVTNVDSGGVSGAGFGGNGINGPAGADPFDEAGVITDGLFVNNNNNGTAIFTFSGLAASTNYDFSAIGGRASNGKDGFIDILTGTSGSSTYSLLNDGTVLDFTVASTAGGLIEFEFYKGDSTDAGGSTINGLSMTEGAAIPEPSAFALLAGMFGLTWVMLRRRA